MQVEFFLSETTIFGKKIPKLKGARFAEMSNFQGGACYPPCTPPRPSDRGKINWKWESSVYYGLVLVLTLPTKTLVAPQCFGLFFFKCWWLAVGGIKQLCQGII